MADLSVKYAGMDFKNPLVGGSGPNYDSIEGCTAAAEAGFSGFVLKSIASRSLGRFAYQHAVPRYKIVERLDHSKRWRPESGSDNMDVVFAGEVGSTWSETDYVEFARKVMRDLGGKVKVAASAYFARDPQERDRQLDLLANCNTDFIELPLTNDFFSSTDVAQWVKKAKDKIKVPLTVKLCSTFEFPVVERVKMLEDAGIDGVTMFDAAVALDIDIETMQTPFRDTWNSVAGGVTVPWLSRQVALCRLAGVKIPITASCGVSEWRHVIKLILCGADAVQVCRKVMVRGYAIAGEWLEEINTWLDERSIENITDLKGKILDNLDDRYRKVAREEPLERGGIPTLKADINRSRCGGCENWCAPGCSYFAIRRNGYKVEIDNDKCAVCGQCEGACPFSAISYRKRLPNETPKRTTSQKAH